MRGNNNAVTMSKRKILWLLPIEDFKTCVPEL
jgi:hypothetical protein